MKTEKLNVQTALVEGAELPFALLRSLSAVTLGKNDSDIPDLEELLEARFFDEEQEIRIFRQEDQLHAVRLRCESSDRVLRDTYQIKNRQFGSQITVCRSLASDEDGQTYVSTVRLCGWEG
jgi:hypothetical protein